MYQHCGPRVAFCATISLARRGLPKQTHRGAAYDLLAPVYGWSTEACEAADLKDTKALLDELASGWQLMASFHRSGPADYWSAMRTTPDAAS